MISIKGLHKYFNKGKQNEIHVINDVTLDLPDRGMVAIFGKSGCGKTTLLNVIGGLDKYAQGSLTIENNDVAKDTDTLRNKYVGYIFQNYNLNKEQSCFENVANALRLCGMTDETEISSRVMAALQNVGMEKYSKRTPDTLSGGQQQRIAIARAIVKNPRIILADEPTGNLDEANTVMIMDLLKAIAEEHLVLLVTHEANLVDYYCDKVIELSDGKVVGTKENSNAGGYSSKDKNHIYLGELNKQRIENENAVIEYYGEAPSEPIRLKIVNSGGKLYVELGTERVQVLDEFSEVKLKEGVFEEKSKNSVSGNIDMSRLPPVSGTKFGRLFSFKSSVKSGFAANFRSTKKTTKALRRCMSLFATVVVFMSAMFGTSFQKIIEANDSYNHNVFYVKTEDIDASAKLNQAVGDASSGIDFLRLSGQYMWGETHISFYLGAFETFDAYNYSSTFSTNAVYLDETLAKDLKLVEGKKEIGDNELLITTKVADALLEKSSLGYISERRDLLGLITDSIRVGGKSPSIVGIVESDESAIYLSELALARYVRDYVSLSYSALASDYGYALNQGETVLAIKHKDSGAELPGIGETVSIQGISITVVDILEYYNNYAEWLEASGIKKTDEYSYFKEIILTQSPGIKEGSVEFNEAYTAVANERYFEYCDYYYGELDGFIKNYYFFEPNSIDVWMYVNKGVEDVKYLFVPEDYAKANMYKKTYGRYPTLEELWGVGDTLPDIYASIKDYYMLYEMDFYYSSVDNIVGNNAYLLSDEDYIATSKQMGKTHPSADSTIDMSYGKDYVEYASTSVDMDIYYYNPYYTIIHSSDPELTEQWLREAFPNMIFDGEDPQVYTPSGIFKEIIASSKEAIITGLITMAVILALMCVCMYFIMRSSLMNRIKEIGIYRAIGVTKKNLTFKFFIEATVLTTLSVTLGFLLSSAFMYACLSASSLVEQIFYYPVWLAIAVLIVLYAISLFFGTLPIMSLLRKTPSEILAKYDI